MNINSYLVFLYICCFALAFIGTVILTPFLIRLGKFYNIVDRFDERKITLEKPPIRIGGLAIAFVTLSIFGLVGIFLNQFSDLNIEVGDLFILEKIFIISLISIFFLFIGFSDDLFTLSPWPRLALQIAGGFIAYYNGIQIKS